MLATWLFVIGLISAGNAQFGGFGGVTNAVKNPVGTASQTATAAVKQAEALATEWLNFKDKYKKVYASPQEELQRNAAFVQNLASISKISDVVASGLFKFSIKLNEFGDLLSDEFNKLLNGLLPGDHTPAVPPQPFTEPPPQTLPDSIDWRQLGAVSPVKHQGQCASCHAFSACGAIEGHEFRKNGKLLELSPQDVLDCAKGKYQSFGCTGGGYVDEDYSYIKNNLGVNPLSIYPYEGKDLECKQVKNNVDGDITGYVQLPEGDEQALKKIVGTLGPVSVGIDASHQSFQFYSSGVYHEKDCQNKPENQNHAVLIVGYGEEDGQKYWLVKNSYGADWGMEGYIKMARDADNHCGIATNANYPEI